MPAFTLTVSSQGSFNSWALSAGASKPSAVGSNDGDGSWIYSDVAQTESMVMTDLPADAATISGSVTFGAALYDRFNNSQTGQVGAYNGSSSQAVSSVLTAAWVYYSGALANVPGGSGWTVAQVNAIECSIAKTGADRVGCTYMDVTGTYLQAGETFVSIYNLVGPMLFGAGLTLADMWAAAGKPLYYGRTKLLYQPQEIRQAWDEYKAHRFPTYHFQGASLGV